jgi:hypothetical protein
MQFHISKHDLYQRLYRVVATLCARLFGAISFRFGIALLICLTLLLPAATLVSASSETFDYPAHYLNIPLEFGEVIYRINTQSPKQLYIIGINHKDPYIGTNNSTTVQTQVEIFRIGEWLKKNMRLNLLLPEGYFSANKIVPDHNSSAIAERSSANPISLDNFFIEEKLAAVKPYVNAEMLLMKYHSFHASQVEDRNTYNAVRNSLGKLRNTSTTSPRSSEDMAELLYLQEVRTAQLLQNIPGVIENQFQNGAIGNHSALFTIGLNHIEDIFHYINNDEIHITMPTGSDVQAAVLRSRLHLLEKGYGVTIILPRTLANNHKLLQLTRVDKILIDDQKYSNRILPN